MLYMFLADGFEEVEAIACLDVLRRAKVEALTVGVSDKVVTGAHGIAVQCDKTVADVSVSDGVDGVILPGGMPGTVNLEEHGTVREFISYCADSSKLICAICAAPSILGHMGLLDGRNAVCFPGFEADLKGAVIADSFVVRDANFITCKGMGSAIDFGLEIAAEFIGKERAAQIKKTLQCPC